MDVDLYAYFGLRDDCTAKDIQRAYKKKAREAHPDKNQDNPLAKESFQQLAIYFEILHDPVKRKEYDQKWKAKREAIKRMESMDSSRRKLKEELEAREAAAMALRKRQFETVVKQQAADQIRRDWERHTEEMKWQAERKRKSTNEETDDVKFKCTKSDQAVVRFGDVIAFVIGKRGSAIAEFSTYNEAEKAIKASERGAVGLPSLPLQLSWLSISNTNVVSDSNNVKDKQVEKDEFIYEPTPNNKQDFMLHLSLLFIFTKCINLLSTLSVQSIMPAYTSVEMFCN
ncbi:DnaJ subfamily C member 17 [Schistosoma bovis]|uniref:DnaJ subfamily C member 17 n=1 Tax=Schistosoma bovis TaxID=6184 RepID=A0A430QS68_SCHBO|nr:DnaJ subfamily C member 17 [Schistosoma bovis]